MIRCLDLLSLNYFKGIELIAGSGGLGNAVTWPYAKHTEKIGQYVRGGELVFVSGYDGFSDEDSLCRLMQECVDNEISGIVIESGVQVKEITKKMMDFANKHDLPLFWLEKQTSFIDITKEISTLIMEDEYSEKRNNIFI